MASFATCVVSDQANGSCACTRHNQLNTPHFSRLEAFQAQGVSLKHSWRSWSGVRQVDGVVVFALVESDVQSDDDGSRCLLWSWESTARFGLQASAERLAHCRLAAWHAAAEGILVRSDALVPSRETFELRVERLASEYWALWGSAAQGRRLRETVPDMRFACGATI